LWVKNVTITLDDEVARWVRVYAAERNTSVSRLVGELLGNRMRADRGYAAAMRRFLNGKPQALQTKRQAYPKRDSLHERHRIR
jgi:hypothetical protein